ncbi:MAG TPA: DUF4041 domain-containing protein [Gaiellaceae bacterium]|nr:DUF4041 domain-containing protein [Gaiellaceae bacterium]
MAGDEGQPVEPRVESAAAALVPASVGGDGTRAPLFGARRRVKELAAEVAELRSQLDRVGGLTLLEVERRRAEATAELEEQRTRLERERADAAAALAADRAGAEAEKERLLGELETLRAEVVETRDVALLQEAGVYEYRHPLAAAVSYQAKLREIQSRVKTMVRADGGAVLHSTEWTVNGSTTQGRKMVREYSKLMLRAYNAEADNLIRGLKPYKLDAAVERLKKVAETIRRLGATMEIQISDEYQALRVYELEVTADYVAKLAEEKEREREERERLREERRAQQEIERERARLEKERQHYLNALQALRANGDETTIEGLEAELSEIERAIQHVDYRAANIRAGYVYVISNIGSFGERLVKIGMTRRLEPTDRIRELGDASVPFRYDTHALFFSDDAVGIEAALHQRLADRRVNRVNARREFFYATPSEVKQHLLELTGTLLSYEEMPEALEFRQSQNIANESNGDDDSGAGLPDLLEVVRSRADAQEDAAEPPVSSAEPSVSTE